MSHAQRASVESIKRPRLNAPAPVLPPPKLPVFSVKSRKEVIEATPFKEAGHLRAMLLARLTDEIEGRAQDAEYKLEEERASRLRAEQEQTKLHAAVADLERAVAETPMRQREAAREARKSVEQTLKDQRGQVKDMEGKVADSERALAVQTEKLLRYRGQAENVMRALEAKLNEEQATNRHLRAQLALRPEDGRDDESVVSALRIQLEEAHHALATMRAKSQDDAAALASLMHQLHEREAETMEMQMVATALRTEAQVARAQVAHLEDLKGDAATVEEAAAEWRAKARRMEDYAHKLEGVLRSHEGRVAGLSHQLERDHALHSSLLSSPIRGGHNASHIFEDRDAEVAADLLTARLAKQVETLEEENAEIRRAVSELEDENAKLKFEGATNDPVAMSREFDRMKLDLAGARDEIRRLSQQLDEQARELDHVSSDRQIARQESQLSQSRMEREAQLEAELAEAGTRLRQAGEDVAEARHVAEEWREAYESHEAEAERAAAAMEESHAMWRVKMVMLTKQLASKDSELEAALAALQQSQARDKAKPVVQESEHAQVKELASRLADSSARYEDAIQRERDKIADMQHKHAMALAEKDAEHAHLQRQLENADRKMRRNESKFKEELKREGDERSRSSGQLEGQLAAKTAQVAQLEDDIKRVQQQRESLERECSELRSSRDHHPHTPSADAARDRNALETAMTEVDRLRGETVTLRRELEGTRRELEDLQAKLEDLQQAHDTLEMEYITDVENDMAEIAALKDRIAQLEGG